MITGADKIRFGQIQGELAALQDWSRGAAEKVRELERQVAEKEEKLHQVESWAGQATTYITSLEGQVRDLKTRYEQLGGGEPAALARSLEQLRADHNERERAVRELDDLRRQIVVVSDVLSLQEVGIYEYRHPLDTVLAYKDALADLRERIRRAVSGNAEEAVTSVEGLVLGGSAAEGRKLARDLRKLMLRAYNSEADTIVRTLRPYGLDKAIVRLEKARETIAKLGSSLRIRVTADYHALRVEELELMADYLVKQEDEKETRRAIKEAEREEAAVRREIEAAAAKLRRERSQYAEARARAVVSGDGRAIEQLDRQIAEVDDNIEAVEAREANTRTGYVYVISNLGAFGERMVKIGMTRRLDPMDRVRELGDASVPFRFDTHALIFSQDAVGLEAALHAAFADRRVNRVNMRREFFYASPADVRAALEQLDTTDLLLEFDETIEALEYRTSMATV